MSAQNYKKPKLHKAKFARVTFLQDSKKCIGKREKKDSDSKTKKTTNIIFFLIYILKNSYRPRVRVRGKSDSKRKII